MLSKLMSQEPETDKDINSVDTGASEGSPLTSEELSPSIFERLTHQLATSTDP